MYVLGRLLSHLVSLLAIVSSAAVALMMFHITLDVAMKYFFNMPLVGTLAIVSNYYMPAAIFLPLALCERSNGHIDVEVLTQLFSRPLQRWLAALAWLIAAGVFAILTYRTAIDALDKQAIGTFVIEQDTRIDVWPSYYLLPIGFGLVTAVLLYRFLVAVAGLRSGLGERAHASLQDHTAS